MRSGGFWNCRRQTVDGGKMDTSNVWIKIELAPEWGAALEAAMDDARLAISRVAEKIEMARLPDYLSGEVSVDVKLSHKALDRLNAADRAAYQRNRTRRRGQRDAGGPGNYRGRSQT